MQHPLTIQAFADFCRKEAAEGKSYWWSDVGYRAVGTPKAGFTFEKTPGCAIIQYARSLSLEGDYVKWVNLPCFDLRVQAACMNAGGDFSKLADKLDLLAPRT